MKIVNKRFYKENTKVVDLQIKDTHNFAMGLSRIIVHNSWIRPRGSFIHGIGVESPGAVKYMELYDKSSDIVTAGSGKKSLNKKAKGKIRKGAMMGILSCFHPDLIEFITAKQQPGRLSKFNVSVNCSDDFMQKVIKVRELKQLEETEEIRNEIEEIDKWNLRFPDTTFEKYKEEWDGDIQGWEAKGYPVIIYNTVSATWLWNLITESTYQRAEPGVLFLDRANYYNPLNYKEKIQATNPSLVAGTKVLTKEGIFPIDELEGKEFYVKSMDGQWAKGICRLSGENEEIYEIKLVGGKSIFCTKEHKWPVYDTRMKRMYKVETCNIKSEDIIPLNRNERLGIEGDMSLTEDEGFLLGYFIGDGWFGRRKDGGNLYGGFVFGKNEKDLAEKIISILNPMKKNESNICERDDCLEISFTDQELCSLLMNKYGLEPNNKKIPDIVWKSNDDFIKGFVDGIFSADGHVSNNTTNMIRMTFTTAKECIATDFAKLLSFYGIHTTILYSTSKNAVFPNGKYYEKEYMRWDVSINGCNILNFTNIFSLSHTEKNDKLKQIITKVSNKRKHRGREFIEVVEVTKTDRTEKVWDISVDHPQHVFPMEWCYTSNCGEQTLSPGNICTLGSVNLTQFILDNDFDYRKIGRYVGYLVRFLDNVNEISNAPLPEYVNSMRQKRRIGCGILGWGSALMMMKVRFGSEKARNLREKVISTIARASYEASVDLAEERGMFYHCVPEKHVQSPFIQNLGLSKKYMDKMAKIGIRNSSLLSCQPTGNTSLFANVVSGGIEPIFMPEYIRTVIVNTMPEHIKDVCPKWFEGEWYETEMFKEAKEGDETILRGIDENGVVYKIDKNRGLTKEVPCMDYAVRYLRNKNEWDATADYVATTNELTVEEHLDDLAGFAKYTDSAISKTINIQNDYPFEDFQNVYLDAYKTGYIKGVTTYRAGTMTSVLSAKEEQCLDCDDEEIIIDDIKVPSQSPAIINTLKADGRKWYLTTVMDETGKRPVALFVHTNHPEKEITTHDAVEKLLELAKDKNVPQKWIDETVEKIKGDNNPTKIARCISMNLRHGVLIKNVANVLSDIDCLVGSFLFQIRKYLMSYIRDGERVGSGECPSCGAKDSFVFQEGCTKCLSCGMSKCS